MFRKSAALFTAAALFAQAFALPQPYISATETATTTTMNTLPSAPAGSSATSAAKGSQTKLPWQNGVVNPQSKFLRGVNIGAWLILEKWMTPELFDGTDAVDQYTFDQTEQAADKLHSHWASYFTEADVKKLKTYGVNA